MPDVTVSLSDNMLRQIEQAARAQHRTRDGLLQEAAEQSPRKTAPPTPPRLPHAGVPMPAVSTMAGIRHPRTPSATLPQRTTPPKHCCWYPGDVIT